MESATERRQIYSLLPGLIYINSMTHIHADVNAPLIPPVLITIAYFSCRRVFFRHSLRVSSWRFVHARSRKSFPQRVPCVREIGGRPRDATRKPRVTRVGLAVKDRALIQREYTKYYLVSATGDKSI